MAERCRECEGAKIVVVDYDEAECCELTEECPACNGTGEGEYYNDEPATPEPSADSGNAPKGDGT